MVVSQANISAMAIFWREREWITIKYKREDHQHIHKEQSKGLKCASSLNGLPG